MSEWFADITEQARVGFVHVTGTNYSMPDQIGSGAALLDFDGDTLVDLYFVQNGGEDSGARNQLFRQLPDGTFRNVSAGSGLDVAGRGMGAIAGDVNNDGMVDVIVTEPGKARLFQNAGAGVFREVTDQCGLDNPRWGVPASFLDFDRDGWLDLAVGNYVDYDPTQVCHNQGGQDFCDPQAFAGTVARLWRNATAGAGSTPLFEDVTERSRLTAATGAALGLVCADFDGDAWPDIFIADDGRPNRLFVNRRDGTFTEEAFPRGLAVNAMGRTAANMGTAYADTDGDGLGDLFITHLTEEFHSLFHQDRPGLFSDTVAQSGLQDQAWRGTGFGAVMTDFDHDGSPDIAFVNGLVRRTLRPQAPVLDGVQAWWARYAQFPQLFINDGAGRFRDVSIQNPAFCGRAMPGRSLAVGDLDRDGALDLVAAGTDGPARLFRNIASKRGHWLRLRLLDPSCGGRDAIGSEAVVRAGGRPRWAMLQPATSYLSSHEPVVHFGLGSAESIEEIRIQWADGSKESFAGARADQTMILHKGTGRRVTE